MSVSSNLAHASTLIFGGIMLWLSRPGSSLFSYHPALMSLGLSVFLLEAILLMKDKRVPQKGKITVHWICSATGNTLGFLGFLAIYQNKENNGVGHFLSWHGYIGMLTLITLTVVPLGGAAAKYSVGLSKIVKMKPKLIKQGHRLGGIVASIGIFLTVILSFYSTWFLGVTGGSAKIWWLMVGLIFLPRLHLVSLFVQKTSYKQ